MLLLIIDHFVTLGQALMGALQEMDPAFKLFRTSDPQRFAVENPKVNPRIIILVDTVKTAHLPLEKSGQVALVKELYPKSKLVLCDNEPTGNIKKFLRLGVDGYISDTASWADLQTSLETVIKGNKFVETSALVRFLKIHDSTTSIVSDEQIASLSPIERQVTELIIERKAKTEIARIVKRSPTTITSIRERIFSKLGIDSTHVLRKLEHRF